MNHYILASYYSSHLQATAHKSSTYTLELDVLLPVMILCGNNSCCCLWLLRPICENLNVIAVIPVPVMFPDQIWCFMVVLNIYQFSFCISCTTTAPYNTIWLTIHTLQIHTLTFGFINLIYVLQQHLSSSPA